MATAENITYFVIPKGGAAPAGWLQKDARFNVAEVQGSGEPGTPGERGGLKSWVMVVVRSLVPYLRFRFPLSGTGGSAGILPPGGDGTCILGRKVAGGLTGRVDGRGFQK